MTQIVQAESGSHAYYMLRLKSDLSVWNTATSLFETWSDATIANYDLAGSGVFDDKGGDEWLATIPAAAVIAAGNDTIRLVAYYYTVNGTPATTDQKIKTYELNLGGGVASPVAGNYATIGQLVTILQNSARAAGGYSDDNSGCYSLTAFHVALQMAFTDFVFRTRVTRTFSTLSLAEDATTIDFSSLTGFMPGRLLNLWIADEDPISVVSPLEIVRLRKSSDRDGPPTKIGFSNLTTAQIRETLDDDYSLQVEWFPPLTAWTPGDTGVSATLINVPADLATLVASTGAVACLQYGSIEMAPVADRARTAYEALVARSMGYGGTGERSVRLCSRDELEREEE